MTIFTKNGDMEKDLFSNYFAELRRKAHEIDESTEKLSETWKIPHLLIGGYAERTAQTNACLDEIWESLRDTSVSPTGNYIIQCYEMSITPFYIFKMLRNVGHTFLYMQNKKNSILNKSQHITHNIHVYHILLY